MTKEEFEAGIIFNQNDSKGKVLVIAKGQGFILRFDDGKEKKERRFSSPFWQSKKLQDEFYTLALDFGHNHRELETAIITAYDEYQDYLAQAKLQKMKFVNPFNTDFIQICSDMVQKRNIYYDKSGIFWIWNRERKCYEMCDETDILNEIYDAMVFAGLVDKKEKLLTAMRMAARKNELKEKPKTWIQFSDVIYNIETGETFKPLPSHFFVNPIPWKLGESEETPRIDELFVEWVGEDYKIMLYEIAAYCLIEDYPIHRLFWLLGSGRNGKGTFLRLIERFIGLVNTTSTSFEKLGQSRFEAAKLFKKLVAFVGETNFTEIRESAIIKSLTGQDLIGGEFKNKAPFDFYNYAKILIATNSLPVSHDKTKGYYSRAIIVSFFNTFDNGKDVLATIPEWEFENLGRKCVRLLKELLERQGFTKEKNLDDKAKDYEEKSNPIIVFIRERCQKDLYGSIPLYKFCDEFVPFLVQNGHRIQSKREVSSSLRKLGYEVERRTITRDNEQKTYFMVIGISFITEITEITDVLPYTENIGTEYNVGNVGNVSNEFKQTESVPDVPEVLLTIENMGLNRTTGTSSTLGTEFLHIRSDCKPSHVENMGNNRLYCVNCGQGKELL